VGYVGEKITMGIVYVPSKETIESKIIAQMSQGNSKKRHFGGKSYYIYTTYYRDSEELVFDMAKHIRSRGFLAKVLDNGGHDKALEVWVGRK
jgi:hypothetical protein